MANLKMKLISNLSFDQINHLVLSKKARTHSVDQEHQKKNSFPSEEKKLDFKLLARLNTPSKRYAYLCQSQQSKKELHRIYSKM